MLWICKACTTPYSVDAPRCPQCGSTTHVEQGSPEHEAVRPVVGESGPVLVNLAPGSKVKKATGA